MRGGEMDARRLRVVREDLAQPVGLHLADGEYIESRLGHDFLWKAGSKGKRRPYRIGLALASRGHYLIGAMINAAFSALADVLSPDFRSVLFKAVGLAVALLIAVIAGT